MPQDYKLWLDLAQWCFTGLLAAVVWMRKPGEAAQDEARKTRVQLAQVTRDMTHRITLLEAHSTQVPSRVELTKLEGEVQTIRMQMEGQNQQLMTIQHAINRVENFLLDSARRNNTNY